jgi:hypothetical protein
VLLVAGSCIRYVSYPSDIVDEHYIAPPDGSRARMQRAARCSFRHRARTGGGQTHRRRQDRSRVSTRETAMKTSNVRRDPERGCVCRMTGSSATGRSSVATSRSSASRDDGTASRVLPLHLRGASGLGRLPRRHDQTALLLDPDHADKSRSDRLRLRTMSTGRYEWREDPQPCCELRSGTAEVWQADAKENVRRVRPHTSGASGSSRYHGAPDQPWHYGHPRVNERELPVSPS